MTPEMDWATNELYELLTNVTERRYNRFMYLIGLYIAYNFPVDELAAELRQICRDVTSKGEAIGKTADYKAIILRGVEDYNEQHS